MNHEKGLEIHCLQTMPLTQSPQRMLEMSETFEYYLYGELNEKSYWKQDILCFYWSGENDLKTRTSGKVIKYQKPPEKDYKVAEESLSLRFSLFVWWNAMISWNNIGLLEKLFIPVWCIVELHNGEQINVHSAMYGEGFVW